MNTKCLQLKIVLPSHSALLRSGVTQLALPTPAGSFTVVPDGSNLIAAVGPGMAKWQGLGCPEEEVALERGVLIKVGTSVVILTQAVEERKPGLAGLLPGTSTSDIIFSKMKDGFIESVIKLD